MGNDLLHDSARKLEASFACLYLKLLKLLLVIFRHLDAAVLRKHAQFEHFELICGGFFECSTQNVEEELEAIGFDCFVSAA